jgi:hypothetical protein
MAPRSRDIYAPVLRNRRPWSFEVEAPSADEIAKRIGRDHGAVSVAGCSMTMESAG